MEAAASSLSAVLVLFSCIKNKAVVPPPAPLIAPLPHASSSISPPIPKAVPGLPILGQPLLKVGSSSKPPDQPPPHPPEAFSVEGCPVPPPAPTI